MSRIRRQVKSLPWAVVGTPVVVEMPPRDDHDRDLASDERDG
jgi:hypothetical protein